jgi:hypothetical protein
MGRHDGVKEYLEAGQKLGRELGRDELDERVMLAGDLDLTDAIIQSIDSDPHVARYLSITLSFKEDEVDRETMDAVVRQFQAFAFSAYRPDEYNFYAEAHLPRVKSYQDSRTGQLIERKPHIHIVIPKLNLISGQHLEPLGYVKSNIRFIDAFQEHVNARHGLASPKDNRRVELTDASEMISRYKGDMFKDSTRELKESLLDAMLDRKVERYDDFMALLVEHGETRLRNAGRDDEYPNVKLPDAAKGVNLKEHVFSRAFVELPTDEKLLQLSADVKPTYDVAGKPREVAPEIQSALAEWYETRAREVKYLNSGNTRVYEAYRDASPQDRLMKLAELERGFYSQHLKEHHEPGTDGAARTGRAVYDETEQRLRRIGRVFEFKRGSVRDVDGRFPGPVRGIDAQRDVGHARPGAGGARRGQSGRPADRWQYGARAAPKRATAAGFNVDSVHGVPGVPVVRLPVRHPVLLPDHAHRELEHERSIQPDGMRWVRPTGRVADTTLSQRARDVREGRAVASVGDQAEFAIIRRQLDAGRLLATLSHSHGVRPEKYAVTKGRDGGDRIRCGKRQLNVSDFLTKELNLPWQDTSKILRDTWRSQVDRTPAPPAKELPRASLWRDYTTQRDTQSQLRGAAADAQRDSERARRTQIRDAFVSARDAIRAGSNLRPSQRRAAVSVLRMERVTQEATLRDTISAERDAFKARYGAAKGRSFSEYLQERAQAGDDRALVELRRTRSSPPDVTGPENLIMPALASAILADHSAGGRNEILFRGPALSWQVHSNGDVTYRHDGRDVVRDQGPDVRVLQVDRDAIEAGLRLAQVKFGGTLQLAGPEAFQFEAARVAAEAGLYIEFTDDNLNRAMQARRVELVAQRANDVAARHPSVSTQADHDVRKSTPGLGPAPASPTTEEPTR